MIRNTELGDFLRSARARISPVEAGLVDQAPGRESERRVPGLRREEVARLAGVSADYYAKLEQGRSKQASRSVLVAVAQALRLNDTEREYLIALVESRATTPLGSPVAPQHVRPGALRLLNSFENSAAFILGRGTAILAMNDLAKALLFDIEERPLAERNLTVWTFLDPEARERYVDWDAVADDNAAMLRLDVASSPDDPGLTAIVGLLSMKSAEFRAAWGAHHVFECTYGRKSLNHPVMGRIDVDYEALAVPGSPGQTLHIYNAAPGSPADDALRRLGEWASPTADLTAFEAPPADRRPNR